MARPGLPLPPPSHGQPPGLTRAVLRLPHGPAQVASPSFLPRAAS
ncbi:hypothetical protein E2C01_067564 [Portunus trituberculatus]|uniref:Uncharacterized protein n=1 Tax=Portunus trituberculatus TaxID=210409 RepID=A0A5B7HPN2_PORTR|nr:hypothetical protein [Portunus trituberculatus]